MHFAAKVSWVGSAVTLFALTGCASVMPPGETASMSGPGRDRGAESEPGSSGEERGHASYYADRFSGRHTASGERYDPDAMTAAHRTLPFGTIVLVTRTDGRSVRVRVNDRGPYGPHGRIIDLSKRAAIALGMIRDGVVEVTVRIVDDRASDIARR